MDNNEIKETETKDEIELSSAYNVQENVSILSEVFEWLDILSTAMVIVVLVFTFLFRIATIDGRSMQDTFYHGEKVVLSKLFYEPKYGDVVIISRNYINDTSDTDNSSRPIIKRIIATEGQTVKIDFVEGIVYVDGKPLKEDYTRTKTNLKYDIDFSEGVTVPKDCVFVMGDNRNESLDSRSSSIGENGMIDKRYILGRVFLRVFPFNRFGGIK